MKPLSELSITDLREFPVWECHRNSDVDAVVRPTTKTSLCETETGVFVAATEFQLADGTILTGYCSPSDPSGLDYMQPVVLTPKGPLPLWSDSPVTDKQIAKQWRTIDKALVAVFPMTYKCLVPVDGQEVAGVVELKNLILSNREDR
jgi:hypothetical protein